MTQPPKIYNANLKVPAETVPFHIETGESRSYDIYEEVWTGKELLKCDVCGLFLSLKGRSPIMLQQHRGRHECQKMVQKKLRLQPGSFIHMFTDTNSTMAEDQDPKALTSVMPVPPSCSPSTWSSIIGDSTPRASPTTLEEEKSHWGPIYESEMLPWSSPPFLTPEPEDLSDEDNEDEADACKGQSEEEGEDDEGDAVHIQSQLGEDRQSRKRGLSSLSTTSSSAARDESLTKKHHGTVRQS